MGDERGLNLSASSKVVEDLQKESGVEVKLNKAEFEIDELKKRRTEDAKANEKVVAIFAAHEQRWIAERKSLKHHIQALAREIQTLKMKNEEDALSLDQILLAELKRRKELEEEAVAMVDSLSGEVIKLQKESEQKDKILSAMVRKSKLDIAEKKMLLKEVKMSRAKKKQAELEMDRWKNMWESRHKKSSKALRSIDQEEIQVESNGHDSFAVNNESSSLQTIEINEPGIIVDDFQGFQEWVRVETEKCAMILEQRHYEEIEAFTEQMIKKDEKLEAFQWKISSMELESKRLLSHIKGLDENLSCLREENIKLETLLLDKEKELNSKDQLNFYAQQLQKRNHNKYLNPETCQPPNRKSEFKNAKAWPRHNEEVSRIKPVEDRQSPKQDTNLIILESEKDTETGLPSPNYQFKNIRGTFSNEMYIEQYEIQGDPITDEDKSIMMMSNYATDRGSSIESINLKRKEETSDNISSSSIDRKDSTWKMDIHALGVSYKIKRLKQQLIVLEKLAESQGTDQITTMDDASEPEDSNEGKNDESRQQMKGFLQVKSLMNKQLKRYQSLEEKTDDLCRRMQASSRSGSRREPQSGKTKESTQALERYLEETFQLQRYMVATGQKLMEIQSKIYSTLSLSNFGETVGFNMAQFADFVRDLFTDVQRGLEVRIAHIIGDLEGTLACDGILSR